MFLHMLKKTDIEMHSYEEAATLSFLHLVCCNTVGLETTIFYLKNSEI